MLGKKWAVPFPREITLQNTNPLRAVGGRRAFDTLKKRTLCMGFGPTWVEVRQNWKILPVRG